MKEEDIETIIRFLGGFNCETAVDGILAWVNSSDCSNRAYERLKKEL